MGCVIKLETAVLTASSESRLDYDGKVISLRLVRAYVEAGLITLPLTMRAGRAVTPEQMRTIVDYIELSIDENRGKPIEAYPLPERFQLGSLKPDAFFTAFDQLIEVVPTQPRPAPTHPAAPGPEPVPAAPAREAAPPPTPTPTPTLEPDAEGRAAMYCTTGDGRRESRRFKEAIPFYQGALELVPNYPRAVHGLNACAEGLLSLAESELGRNNRKAAETYLRQAEEARPTSPLVLERIDRVRRRLGSGPAAELAAPVASPTPPTAPARVTEESRILAKLESDPENVALLLDLASYYMEIHDSANAIPLLERALHINPSSKDVLINAVRVFRLTDRRDQATVAIGLYHDLYGENLFVIAQLGFNFLDEGELTKAWVIFSFVDSKQPGVRVAQAGLDRLRSRSFSPSGELPKAEELINEAVEFALSHRDLIVKTGRPAERAAQSPATQVALLAADAKRKLDDGEPDAALKFWLAAVAINREDGRVKREAARLFGHFRAEARRLDGEGNHVAAFAECQKALQLRPKDSDLLEMSRRLEPPRAPAPSQATVGVDSMHAPATVDVDVLRRRDAAASKVAEPRTAEIEPAATPGVPAEDSLARKQRLVEIGLRALETRDYKQAEAMLGGAVRIDPIDVELRLRYALARVRARFPWTVDLKPKAHFGDERDAVARMAKRMEYRLRVLDFIRKNPNPSHDDILHAGSGMQGLLYERARRVFEGLAEARVAAGLAHDQNTREKIIAEIEAEVESIEKITIAVSEPTPAARPEPTAPEVHAPSVNEEEAREARRRKAIQFLANQTQNGREATIAAMLTAEDAEIRRIGEILDRSQDKRPFEALLRKARNLVGDSPPALPHPAEVDRASAQVHTTPTGRKSRIGAIPKPAKPPLPPAEVVARKKRVIDWFLSDPSRLDMAVPEILKAASAIYWLMYDKRLFPQGSREAREAARAALSQTLDGRKPGEK